MSNWGKGSENNSIGYGQAAHTSTNGWGESHKTSWAGLTDIVGDPSLSISYSASAFCENASNPTPTVSGNEGSGTFSSTTGLVFVSTSTGEVNISSSTAGATYLITYTDTNAATATFSLTINNLDNAAFAYSASSYEPTDADPTPTITGLSGGTFSSTSGLVFVDSGTNTGSSTGQIDLSATTEASYTITYDTTSSGSSVCPNTSTQTVEIAVAGIANNYSMAFDGVNDYISISSSVLLPNQHTISTWIKSDDLTSSAIGYLFTTETTIKGIGLDEGDGSFGAGKFYYWNGASATTVSTTAITVNNWYHIVFVFDSTANEIKFYLDGNLDKTTTVTIGTAGSLKTLGSYNGILHYLNGKLDEFAIWNTALTSTQVSEIYSAKGTNLTKDLTTVSGSNLVYWNRMGD